MYCKLPANVLLNTITLNDEEYEKSPVSFVFAWMDIENCMKK